MNACTTVLGGFDPPRRLCLAIQAGARRANCLQLRDRSGMRAGVLAVEVWLFSPLPMLDRIHHGHEDVQAAASFRVVDATPQLHGRHPVYVGMRSSDNIIIVYGDPGYRPAEARNCRPRQCG